MGFTGDVVYVACQGKTVGSDEPVHCRDVVYVACQGKTVGSDEPVHCLQKPHQQMHCLQRTPQWHCEKELRAIKPLTSQDDLGNNKCGKKERLIYVRGIRDHTMFQRCAVILFATVEPCLFSFCTCIYDTMYMLWYFV